MSADLRIQQFLPFKSFVNHSFWHKFAEIKIDVLKLSDQPLEIYGFYSNFNSKSNLLEVDYSSFNKDFKALKGCFPAYGTIYNKNTIEEFKDCNKVQLLTEQGERFLNDLTSGRILEDPRLLARFFILSFADLKVHKYYYWFGFPCPMDPSFTENTKSKKLSECNDLTMDDVENAYQQITRDEDKSFFVLQRVGDNVEAIALKDFKGDGDCYFAFCDSAEISLVQPSWLMRTYAYFLLRSL